MVLRSNTPGLAPLTAVVLLSGMVLFDQIQPLTPRRVPITTTMASSYRKEEEKIQRALRAISDALNPNFAQVARAFQCNVRRLRYRHKTGLSKITAGGKNRHLSDAQNKSLCLILDRLDKLGFP